MLHKQFKSTILSLLALSSTCSALESKNNKKFNSIVNKYVVNKYSAATATLIAVGIGLYWYYGGDKLERDLKKDPEIINYIDEDKISLTNEEIKKYSPVYANFLSKLNNDSRTIGPLGKILKESALFLIRLHARLSRRNQQLSDIVIDNDAKRYKNPDKYSYACILSKTFLRTPKIDNYLVYTREKKDMTVLIGLYGWEIKSNYENFDIYYDQSDSSKWSSIPYV